MAQPAPTAQQCTAVLTGVMIRHGPPVAESLTADLRAVVARETVLLGPLAGRARPRAERAWPHDARSEAFSDVTLHAARWSTAIGRRGMALERTVAGW